MASYLSTSTSPFRGPRFSGGGGMGAAATSIEASRDPPKKGKGGKKWRNCDMMRLDPLPVRDE